MILFNSHRETLFNHENKTKDAFDIADSTDFLGTDISDTLVFEDALYAIKSAKRAGFPVVGLYDFSSDNQQDEIKDWSDFYYTSLLDFEKDFVKLRG